MLKNLFLFISEIYPNYIHHLQLKLNYLNKQYYICKYDSKNILLVYNIYKGIVEKYT